MEYLNNSKFELQIYYQSFNAQRVLGSNIIIFSYECFIIRMIHNANIFIFEILMK